MRLIGNKQIIDQLLIAIAAAQAENRAVPHTLMSGAAGCGKTSVSRALAKMVGGMFITKSAESLDSAESVATLVRSLREQCEGYDQTGNKVGTIKPAIIFVDEVHQLKIGGQEPLGILMEEYYVAVNTPEKTKSPFDLSDIDFTQSYESILQELNSKSLKRGQTANLWCPEFTLVGATTNEGLLSKPFRDRFKLNFLFKTYSLEDSIEIVKVHAIRLNIEIDDLSAKLIGMRGRGIPRILVRLLERCKDYARYVNMPNINSGIVETVFTLLCIDNTGLTAVDIDLLKVLLEANGNPVGIDNLAVILNKSKQVISDSIEPYLIQRGLMLRSSRGRIITKRGAVYLVKHGHVEINQVISSIETR